jgi:predicted transcriptional regulator
MAAYGVYLIRPSRRPNQENIRELERMLEADGYKVAEIEQFNSFDIFLKLDTRKKVDVNKHLLSRETLERLEKVGYSDDTRSYEM